MVTGARRGELYALRWTDIDVAEQDLLIERAYAVRRGEKIIKTTRPIRSAALAVDSGTLVLLADHLERCRERAEYEGGTLEEDGYVFSRDGVGELPWNLDVVSHRFSEVAEAAGVDCTTRSLRHYNATQMLTGGIRSEDVDWDNGLSASRALSPPSEVWAAWPVPRWQGRNHTHISMM
jgi:integrase